MKYTFLLLAFLSILCSCKKNSTVTIAFENSSNDSELNYVTFMDNNIVDKRVVRNNKNETNLNILQLKLSDSKKSFQFKFLIAENGRFSLCNIEKDSLTDNTVIHVNYSTILFKKGFNYYSNVLKKDTLVSDKFYSEVMYRGLLGK